MPAIEVEAEEYEDGRGTRTLQQEVKVELKEPESLKQDGCGWVPTPPTSLSGKCL